MIKISILGVVVTKIHFFISSKVLVHQDLYFLLTFKWLKSTPIYVFLFSGNLLWLYMWFYDVCFSPLSIPTEEVTISILVMLPQSEEILLLVERYVKYCLLSCFILCQGKSVLFFSKFALNNIVYGSYCSLSSILL